MSIPKLKDLLNEIDFLKPPRKVGGVAIVSEGQILLVKRSETAGKYPNFWSVPSGGVEDGETSREGAVRELKEETQITLLPDYDLYTLRNKPLNKEGGDYSIYQIKVSDKLTPKLNHEHKDYGYFTQDNLPEPLDKGLSFLKR